MGQKLFSRHKFEKIESGRHYLFRNDFQLAFAFFQLVLQKDPSLATVWCYQAETLAKQEQCKDFSKFHKIVLMLYFETIDFEMFSIIQVFVKFSETEVHKDLSYG